VFSISLAPDNCPPTQSVPVRGAFGDSDYLN
jgi:hypothetical protein